MDEAAERCVWAILCYREGDNAQILAVAEALGWPFEVKRLAYRWFGYPVDVWRGTTLLGIDAARSDPLRPPWPDLIISASMRNEPVCRWIREQSGGRTRYVHMGRTWGRLETFDLVITSPEFRLRRLPNIQHNALTLTRVTPDKLAAAAALWSPRLAHLPRPRVAVLVGGYGGPYALDPEKAARLGREASALARRAGGSLLVTTSARTRPASAEALRAAISVPCHVFQWAADAAADNPFYGYLALADQFIVTCDSASMLAEACATRRPVFMFNLGPDADTSRACSAGQGTLGRFRHRLRRLWDRDRLKAFVYRQMLKVPPRRMTRDIRLVHRFLIDTGRVVWLGQPFPDAVPPRLDEMTPTVARIRALFGDRQRAADSADRIFGGEARPLVPAAEAGPMGTSSPG
jgi:mitochondrial fission protein ELM1